MRKLATLLLAVLLFVPGSLNAQTLDADQTITSPYSGWVNAVSQFAPLQASSTPFFSNFYASLANITQLCLSGDCKTAWPSGGGSGTVGTSTALTAGQVAVATGVNTIGSYASFLFDSTLGKLTFTTASTSNIGAINSAGLDIHANNGTPVALFGAGSGAGATFYGGVNIDGATRLATSLNGPLQANAGAVSATTSVGVKYGGTGQTGFTNNRVLITSATDTIGTTANLVWDNTNQQLGIGETAPYTRLELTATTTNGTTTATGYGVSSSQIRLGSVAEAITVGELLGGIDFVSNDTSLTGGRLVSGSIQLQSTGTHTGVSVPSDMVFYTAPASSVPTEKLRLTATGVGIGTSTPFGRFAITSNGTGADTRAFTVANVNNVAVFSIGDSGETAIGTTTDSNSNFAFAVAPTDNAMAVGDNVARFIHGDPGQTGTNVVIGAVRAASSAYKHLTMNADYDGTLVEQFTFQGDGKLGMGSSSPTYALSSASGANNATKDIKAFFGRADSAVGVVIGTGDGTLNSGFIGTLQNFGFYFVVNNTEVARFNTSGQLGIGTSTPNSTLNLAATANARLTLTDTDATANSKHFFLESNADKFSIGTTSDALVTSTTRALTILNTGFVGIGQASPAAMLTVGGTQSGNAGLEVVPGSGIVAQSYNRVAGAYASLQFDGSTTGFRTSATSGNLHTFRQLTTTLAGATVGAAFDYSTSVTNAAQNMTGISLTTAAVTAANTNTLRGLTITPGAITNAAGATTYVGADITMPAITQTAGTLTSTGLRITGGTVTSGTSYALITTANAGNVGIGTSTPYATLSVVGEVVASHFTATTTATSTFAGGVQAATGYFSGLVEFAGNVLARTGTILDFSNATVKQRTYPNVTWPGTATTTSATTTVPIGQAMNSQLFNRASCRVTSGASGYRIGDGTNWSNYIVASTTAGNYAFTSNNTFVLDENKIIEVGPLTAAQITCGFDITVNN